MNETLDMILAFIAGLLMGALFFGGLWFTVKKSVSSANPALFVLASFVSRMVFVLIGFYFIGAENWQRLIIALAGFIIARFIVIYFAKVKRKL